ncbi:MAG TPA: zincin-like metallopeptidase domain-containing protein [Candidatus Deferrimicrobium sp.]|nr:zincin-like metallopeptidase domain-containing protein [Candidatus Deferrimicrobium sp.]
MDEYRNIPREYPEIRRTLAKTPYEINKTYQQITDILIRYVQKMLDDAKMGKSVNWIKPWSPRGVIHANALTPTRAYSGINQLICTIYCQFHGWNSKFWLTPLGIQKLGGQILPSQEPVIIYGFIPNLIDVNNEGSSVQINKTRREEDKFIINVPRVELHYSILKVPVFNREQTTLPVLIKKRVIKHDPKAECVIINMPKRPPIINQKIDKPFYDLQLDVVHIPLLEQFKSKALYYDTVFHELAHSTGHPKRLGRKSLLDIKYNGDHEYTQEELIAELASAFLSNVCGIKCDRVIINDAIYLQKWLKQLKKWKRNAPSNLTKFIFMAKQASDYILGRKYPKQSVQKSKRESEELIEISLTKDISIS